VIFDPFPDQEALRPLLDSLNAKRVALPWLNGLIVQFSMPRMSRCTRWRSPKSGNDFLEMISPPEGL